MKVIVFRSCLLVLFVTLFAGAGWATEVDTDGKTGEDPNLCEIDQNVRCGQDSGGGQPLDNPGVNYCTTFDDDTVDPSTGMTQDMVVFQDCTQVAGFPASDFAVVNGTSDPSSFTVLRILPGPSGQTFQELSGICYGESIPEIASVRLANDNPNMLTRIRKFTEDPLNAGGRVQFTINGINVMVGTAGLTLAADLNAALTTKLQNGGWNFTENSDYWTVTGGNGFIEINEVTVKSTCDNVLRSEFSLEPAGQPIPTVTNCYESSW